MPKNLKRITGRGDLHFITFCCYQRRPLLGTVRARNAAIKILAEVRARYGFAIVGYVIMPEHMHLLVSESGSARPAKVIQVFKQRLSRRMRGKKAHAHESTCAAISNRKKRESPAILATPLLRFQRVLACQNVGEIALHAR